jgi:DNA topoisomerase-1
MGKYLVIVESPTKAKTLKKFLGKDYIVESSVGHIRDLPAKAAEIPAKYKGEPWARLGVNVDDSFQPLYIVRPESRKKIKDLKALLGGVEKLLLATDEDREGEAISWHLLEVLKPTVPVERMVFHEITKPAILAALQDTRKVDVNLVQAQESRRIIDRLYGYEVSPTLWRKIGPRLSAGRVQSVATRMVVERERARMRFVSAEYWGLEATFGTPRDETFTARLATYDGKRVASGKDFDPDTGKLRRSDVHLLDAPGAAILRGQLGSESFSVLSAEEKPFTRKPAPPFITSTLQQEGNRKLRFDARRTMRAAQRLYENGHITYMRTDSVVLSELAVEQMRQVVADTYGAEYLPAEPRRYKGKVQNAQEAHEAIRPAGEALATPEEIKRKLGDDEARLYDLILTRTLACQMRDARGRRMVLKVSGKAGAHEVVFQANGNVIDFAGFLRAYVEGSDDAAEALAERETILPAVAQGEPLKLAELSAEESRTVPPARLTEASLVKALEESGVGRPSTYASIIDTIQRRGYTFKKGTALVPTFTAFAVVTLMERHLSELIDTGFTARMEERLDAISRGEQESVPYLRAFYLGNGDPGLKALLEDQRETIDAREVNTIPIGSDDEGRAIVVRVGRYGPYVQRGETTAPIPDETCPDELTVAYSSELLAAKEAGERPIGLQPDSGLPIYIKSGRYGPYVQLGDADPDGDKPKMVSLLKDMTPESVDLDTALALLTLPRTLGQDEHGVDIVAHNGRYGPYIVRGSDTRSLAPDDDLLTVDVPRALELLAQEAKGRRGRRAPAPIRVFENVEELGGADVKLFEGRYGPYVSDGEVNASLPRDMQDPNTLTIAHALELLDVQREKKGKKKAKTKKKPASKQSSSKQTSSKKPVKKARKKTASKKPASKKRPG